MTLDQLYLWHREQAERFEYQAENHKTMGAAKLRASISRSYKKRADFHKDAAALLDDLRHGYMR